MMLLKFIFCWILGIHDWHSFVGKNEEEKTKFILFVCPRCNEHNTFVLTGGIYSKEKKAGIIENETRENAGIHDLRLEVMRQWTENHSEHCGEPIPPLPHEGDCQWELPPVLSAMSPGEVSLLLDEVLAEYELE